MKTGILFSTALLSLLLLSVGQLKAQKYEEAYIREHGGRGFFSIGIMRPDFDAWYR